MPRAVGKARALDRVSGWMESTKGNTHNRGQRRPVVKGISAQIRAGVGVAVVLEVVDVRRRVEQRLHIGGRVRHPESAVTGDIWAAKIIGFW